ncbi:PilZ domain-containing protein [Desulfonatronum lacustre]|uniref:PilZ domain-containing protein n=1 Tax=Desulfonatronum lacustre TaxID=66849 RepID=UPI000491C8D9|nr:PilZ domain-containing protein [Desulfonatronum lacustre]
MDDEQRNAPRVDVEPDFSVLRMTDGRRFMAIVYDISRVGVLVDLSQNEGRHDWAAVGERVEFLAVPECLRFALQGVVGRIVRREGSCWGVEFTEPLVLEQPEIDRLQEHLEVPVGPEWSKF